jgi:hypothetical protein
MPPGDISRETWVQKTQAFTEKFLGNDSGVKEAGHGQRTNYVIFI